MLNVGRAVLFVGYVVMAIRCSWVKARISIGKCANFQAKNKVLKYNFAWRQCMTDSV
jgi:hypothetical protein